MSIFRRRNKRNPWSLMRHLVWPAMGWKRVVKYGAYRVGRIDGSANSIAIGVAWGVAVSFTPFYFLHIGIAVLGSWLMGGSMLAAAIGTLFLNPLTFPFISWLTYTVGRFFFPPVPNLYEMGKISIPDIMDNFYEIFMPLVLPMVFGGLVVGTLAWIVIFFVVRALVSRYRHIRLGQLERRDEDGKQSES